MLAEGTKTLNMQLDGNISQGLMKSESQPDNDKLEGSMM